VGRKKHSEQDYCENQVGKLNHRKRIKLRLRKLNGGGYSIFLAMSQDRKWQYLNLPNLKLSGKKDDRVSDDNILKVASNIRDNRELEIIKSGNLLPLDWESKEDFLAYFDELVKRKNNASNWRNTRKKLQLFSKGSLNFGEIDRRLCVKFSDFLKSEVSANSAKIYYGIFKTALKQAVLDEILQKNPASGISIPTVEMETTFLTLTELRTLDNTPCEHPDIKNAFIFSCFTGLRFSDAKSLKWMDINEGAIIKRQKKTGMIATIPLASAAKIILEQQKELNKDSPHAEVFHLPTNANTNRAIKKWAEAAGIKKKITYHCSRHTFGVLSLDSGIDIYTISKLMGHTNVTMTQRYAKLSDYKRDKEIQKLPEL